MAEALRILHIDDGREWRGGQHQVSLLAEGLHQLGVQQRVATLPGSPLSERLRNYGVEVAPIKFRGEWDWQSPRKLAQLAGEFGADILHAHTAHAHTFALRAFRHMQRSAKENTVPQVVSTRRVDFPVGRTFFSRRKYLHPGQHFIAISNAIRRELMLAGIPSERIDLVPSGVPSIESERALNREQSRLEFGIPENAVAIGTVGALVEHKGHRWLLEAAREVLPQIPEAQFLIMGEGKLRGELENFIQSHHLEKHVRLVGHVDQARMKLAGFDLYVSPSHLEGLGTSILDAMLAGVPVVAAAAGGVIDIVRHDETGLLAPPRDPHGLATEIVRAFRMPQAARDKITEAALRLVEGNFSARSMVQGTLGVYQKMIGSALKRPAVGGDGLL